jgi:cytochrome c551/c552
MYRELRLLSKTFGKLFIAASLLLSTSLVNAQGDTAESSPKEAPEIAPVSGADGELVKIGLAIYQDNCTQCHAFSSVVVGPALKDAHKNWASKSDMLHFIQYPQKVIDGGDAHAKSMYEQYKQYMPNHDFLSEQELEGLYAFIVSESENPTLELAVAETVAVSGEGAGEGSGVSDGFLQVILVVLIVILIAIIVALVLLTGLMKRFVASRDDISDEEREYISPHFDLVALIRSKPFVRTVILVFVLVVLKSGIDGLYSVGIQQGYAPSQPINFSHKLHAGMYEINCQYCHTGVTKSKNANIPSSNICMNCHNTVKVASPEIQKIYQAIEKNKPIEWVRVHNLPDLAYFNHSQHVVVGELECQTCHGPVQEMEVIQQYSTLTMGWCVNCHRETLVKAEGNEYYDNLLEFHEGKKGGMTVEDIGGLECSKCHY